MMKRLIFLSLFGMAFICAQAQESTTPVPFQNADGVILQNKVTANPDLYNKYVLYEQNFQEMINAANSSKTDTLIEGKRIIPVVFHIIHKGGIENISREQVEDAVAKLNLDYNKLNSDTDATHSWPAFAGRRANCQVEFRLAKIDPQGNCTDGIVRHYDPQTNYAYFTTMSQYAWPPSHYMNIFSVAFIYPAGMTLPEGAFIGGMSPFPPSNALSQALTGGDTLADGVLIRHDGLGSIGTATTLGGMPINALNRTFTHETGHYFNLYHTFQNLIAGIYPASSGCPSLFSSAGDEVADTPPVDVATQNTSLACHTPGVNNTCSQDVPDEVDMVENYMDYQFGYCTNIFTTGQYTRIDATLNGDRRKLWSVGNLVATGVLDTTPSICAPVAEFYANKLYICAGNSLNFSDFSFGGPATDWTWTFTGGTPATSTLQNPTVQYNTPGDYDVTLVASNINGQDTSIRLGYIHVLDPATTTQAPITESFEISDLNNWPVMNDAGNGWVLNPSAFYSGSKCLSLNNFTDNIAGGSDEVISPSYDLTTLPTGVLPMLKFKLAYAGKYVAGTMLTPADTIYDKLSLYVSTDCGATWSLKYNESGIDLSTVATVPDDFAPTSTADWREEKFSLPLQYLSLTNMRLKFVFYSNGGNNIYIDDINIVSSTADIEETDLSQLNLSVQPNPMTESAEVRFFLSQESNVQASVFDMLGRKVYDFTEGQLQAGSHRFTLTKNEIGREGMYFIKVNINGQCVTEKLILQ